MTQCFWLMEEDLENREHLLSLHTSHDDAHSALIRHLVAYRKENPYCHIVKTYHYADYTDKGLMWWRIKTFKVPAITVHHDDRGK